MPGIKLKFLVYDTQFDPSRYIPGYEWLKQKGADVFVAGLPGVGLILRSRVEKDRVVLFCFTAEQEALYPPEYVFDMSNTPSSTIKTLLKWVAENDWDWQTKGPAKVGSVGWAESYFVEIQAAAKKFVEAHPKQFQWIGDYLLPESTFVFGPEVDGLKDVDYVMPPGAAFPSFVRQYHQAHGKGKLLCTDPQANFIGFTAQAAGWDAMDGALLTQGNRWWNEDAEVSKLALQLVRKNHTDADEIIASGMSYIGAMHQTYAILEIIKKTVEDAGPANFSQQALYSTTATFSGSLGDAYPEWGFSDSDREAWDYLGIYKLSAAEKDVVRLDPNWFPIVRTQYPQNTPFGP